MTDPSSGIGAQAARSSRRNEAGFTALTDVVRRTARELDVPLADGVDDAGYLATLEATLAIEHSMRIGAAVTLPLRAG